MPRNITPVNDVTPAPEVIPDRSDLSKLYKHPGAKTPPHESERVNRANQVNVDARDMDFLATVTINLLVCVPYILSFISISTIYSLGEASGVEKAFENRMTTMVLTVVALLPWVFSIRILSRHLSNYRLSPFGLTVLYALFIFPVLDISLTLREHTIASSVILAVTLILSQVYIWCVAYAINSKNSLVSLRALPAALFILILIVIAVLVG